MLKKILTSNNALTLIAVMLGIITGFSQNHSIIQLADVMSDITVRLMKLVALPLLFLSIISSASYFKSFEQIRKIGLTILKYTTLTTFLSALVAEVLYFFMAPYLLSDSLGGIKDNIPNNSASFFATLLSMVPDNIIGVFIENNVMAAVVIAIVLGIAIVTLKDSEKNILFGFFTSLLNAIMSIVKFGLKFIPISVWAFVTMLTEQIAQNNNDSINAISGLTITVITANIIQAVLVLPIFLRLKGIRPVKLFLEVKEALIVAFFTRSSMAALPITLQCSINNARVNSDIAKLSLPLCTTINMNGCAQFILLSVYFVCAFTGNPLSAWEHMGMIFLSVIAAIGNAGVPMGCFFLASSILASKDIPLHLMGSILPLYTFIDMVETSLNVWSDIGITKVVDKEVKA